MGASTSYLTANVISIRLAGKAAHFQNSIFKAKALAGDFLVLRIDLYDYGGVLGKFSGIDVSVG